MKFTLKRTFSLLYFETIFTLFYTLPYIAKTPDATIVYAETSLGDLIDKISVLQIKQANINDPLKRTNIDKELQLLQDILQAFIKPFQQLKELSAQLLQVNKNLWTLEDALRLKEQQQCFDNEFITIVDSILTNNDERAYIKRTINVLCGSHIIEEKSYAYVKEVYIGQNCAPTEPCTIISPLSLGDLVDRITILLIKKEFIKDPAQLSHIIEEYEILIKTLKEAIETTTAFNSLLQDLLQVNRTNWYNFDRIREKKQLKEFDEEFIKLARSVYHVNDHRCNLKKQINILYGSSLVEEKCYTKYDVVMLS
jgi:Asp-tRNA(Asn)/Glu-tRNA(Gln) amidotransferase C subunit